MRRQEAAQRLSSFCVLEVLTGLKWPTPAQGPVRVQFAVSAP